jgi:hypothetical protein
VGTKPAAEVRAELVRAARAYQADRVWGLDGPPSLEAEAGEILEAETALAIHGLHDIAEAWRKANEKS